MALRKVSKSESYSRQAIVDKNTVKFQHLTLHKSSNVHYLLNTTFDFDKVDHKTLLRLAGETLLIRWRTAFKDAETVDDAADNQVVAVAAMLKGRKPRMSKADKVENLAATMSQEEIQKAIAALQAKVTQQQANAKG